MRDPSAEAVRRRRLGGRGPGVHLRATLPRQVTDCPGPELAGLEGELSWGLGVFTVD